MKHANRLPDETVPPAGVPRIAAIIAGVAVLTLLANAGAYALLKWKTPNVFDELAYAKWRLIDSPPPGTDSLILGDSSANQGVDPRVLEDRLGGGWINLGSVANQLTIDDAWMLDRYIQLHGPPRRVVVVHVYDMWRRRMDPASFAKLPLPWGFWDRMDPPLSPSLEQQAQIFVARYVPLYSSDVSLRHVLMQPWKVPSLGAPLRGDGFMPMEGARPEEVEVDFQEQAADLATRPPQITAASRAGLERMLELSEQHGFPLYIAFGPGYDKLAALAAHREYVTETRRLLQQIIDDHPRARLVLESPPPFPLSQLQNVEHLTVEGAHRYTMLLAERIEALEATGN